MRDGEIRRGVFGASAESLNADYVELFELNSANGALIQSVEPRLPAALAGMKPGDVVVALDGEVIHTATELRLKVALYAPGDELVFRVIREAKELEIKVRLTDPNDPFGTGVRNGQLLPGVFVSVLDDEVRERFGIDPALGGLLVTSVLENSPYREGFPEAAVILEINGRVPESLDEGISLINARKVSRLYIYFKGQRRYLSVRVD